MKLSKKSESEIGRKRKSDLQIEIYTRFAIKIKKIYTYTFV